MTTQVPMDPSAQASASVPPPADKQTAAKETGPRRRTSGRTYQRGKPWDDPDLMAARRRQADSLGPLSGQELTLHLEQRVQAQEYSKRARNYVPTDWNMGDVFVNIWDSALWLRDPAHKDKTYEEYCKWAVREIFHQDLSWSTIERRVVLATSYTLEEADEWAAKGLGTTVLSFIGSLDLKLRPMMLNLAVQTGLPVDALTSIGARAQRKLDKDPLAAAEATLHNAVLAYEKDKERRRNGKRGGDPKREAELAEREAALQRAEADLLRREKELADRERMLVAREDAARTGGDVSEVAEKRLRDALEKEAAVRYAQEQLASEKAALAGQKEALERQAAQIQAQTADLVRREQELKGQQEQGAARAAELAAREQQVVERENGIAPAWKELEEQQATYKPREDELATRIEQADARDRELCARAEQLKLLETEYKEGLQAIKGEEQRLRGVAAELREARQQLSNGILVLQDSPVDMDATMDCIGLEAERIVELGELAEEQLDDDEVMTDGNGCKGVLEAWMKVNYARDSLEPVIRLVMTRLCETYPKQAEKALTWGDGEKKVYARKLEEAKKAREAAAREAALEEAEADEDEDEDEE